jgi:hypothetical protein
VSFVDDLLGRFEPWMTDDLDTYLRAIAEMFTEVELLAFETDDTEAWQVLFDPDLIPEKGLPYLAQFLGEKLPDGISEPLAREWLNDNPYSIFRAAQRHLTGGRAVSMSERDDGSGPDSDPEFLQIVTFEDETPNPTQTEADIRSVLPADVILEYAALPGQTWADVESGFADWAAADTAYDTWIEMATELGGTSVFSRSIPS